MLASAVSQNRSPTNSCSDKENTTNSGNKNITSSGSVSVTPSQRKQTPQKSKAGQKRGHESGERSEITKKKAKVEIENKSPVKKCKSVARGTPLKANTQEKVDKTAAKNMNSKQLDVSVEHMLSPRHFYRSPNEKKLPVVKQKSNSPLKKRTHRDVKMQASTSVKKATAKMQAGSPPKKGTAKTQINSPLKRGTIKTQARSTPTKISAKTQAKSPLKVGTVKTQSNSSPTKGSAKTQAGSPKVGTVKTQSLKVGTVKTQSSSSPTKGFVKTQANSPPKKGGAIKVQASSPLKRGIIKMQTSSSPKKDTGKTVKKLVSNKTTNDRDGRMSRRRNVSDSDAEDIGRDKSGSFRSSQEEADSGKKYSETSSDESVSLLSSKTHNTRRKSR